MSSLITALFNTPAEVLFIGGTTATIIGNAAKDVIFKDDGTPPPIGPIPWDTLRGFNYRQTGVLARKQNGPAVTAAVIANAKAHADDHVATAKAAGWNLFRIVVNWEGAVGSDGKTIMPAFLDVLKHVVAKCKANGIYVWIDWHHFFCSSHMRNGADGFPLYMVKPVLPSGFVRYTDKKTYDAGTVSREFWDRLYTNTIPGLNAWNEWANFMNEMINAIDSNDNVIGYEILNEPHVWRPEHFAQMGDMLTFIGNKMRAMTNKYIIFTRETAHGPLSKWGSVDERVSMRPRLSSSPEKIWWTPHHYAVPGGATSNQNLVQYQDVYDKIKNAHGITMPPMAWGECAVQSDQYCPKDASGQPIYDPANPNSCPALLIQSQRDANHLKMVQEAHVGGRVVTLGTRTVTIRGGIIPVYWAGGAGQGPGNQLTDPATGALTATGESYKKATQQVF